MEPKFAVFFMRLGMVLIILGAITFLFIGDYQNPMERLIIGWACACATAIFIAGSSGIDSLKKELAREQRKARQASRTEDSVTDFLDTRSSK